MAIPDAQLLDGTRQQKLASVNLPFSLSCQLSSVSSSDAQARDGCFAAKTMGCASKGGHQLIIHVTFSSRLSSLAQSRRCHRHDLSVQHLLLSLRTVPSR